MSDWPTAAWVSRCDAELRQRGPAGGPLSIGHTIDDGDRSFSYHVVVDPAGSRARTGVADQPTVTFRQSIDTAVAIRSGGLAPGEAVLLGQVEVRGDAAILVEHRALLAELDAVMSSVS